MLPNIVIVDKSGPYNGADIHKEFIVVRQRQKHKVVQGLRMFMPDVDFRIMSKQEYENEIEAAADTNQTERQDEL